MILEYQLGAGLMKNVIRSMFTEIGRSCPRSNGPRARHSDSARRWPVGCEVVAQEEIDVDR